MGNEDIKPPKGPWGRGEEFEKKLGSEEVARIRAEASEGPKAKKTRAYAMPTPKDLLERIHRRQLEAFRISLMKLKGETFSKTYTVGSDGYIQWEEEGDSVPDLLICAPSPVKEPSMVGDTRVVRIHFRSEDLREAAHCVSEKYPYVLFEFEESPSRDKITYTTTLKRKE